ncbi:MAG TPA: hypothetical protein VF789_19105 [Thermoanaerobaculia bacterium]
MTEKDFSDLAADIDRLRESVVQLQRRAVAQIGGRRRSEPPLDSSVKTPVSLLRWQWSRDAATLVPGSTEFHLFERERNPNGPPYWLPDVPVHGYFDCIGGAFLALYRTPDDDSILWFQLDGHQIALTEAVSSKFSPLFADDEPRLESADVERRFQLFEGDTLLVDHSYRLDDREKRLYFGIDPFPSWPDEEASYDLFYFLHQILQAARLSGVFKAPPQR